MNTFGHNLLVTLFGESHNEEMGIVLDGIIPGVSLDCDYIKQQLTLRRPVGKTSTQRVECDDFRIISGVLNGVTTGTPICILMKNSNFRSSDYEDIKNLPRPSHADYSAYCKYNGFADYRGGGMFSGRLTALLVVAGAIILPLLRKKGIKIATHISKCKDIFDRDFDNISKDIDYLSNAKFAVLDTNIAQKMKDCLNKTAEKGDSIGGILETAVVGLPAGVGEPFFSSLESMLSHIIFSIPAVKGIEFGLGFNFSDYYGSECNDEFAIKNGKIVTTTNNNGGINGGISNSMPIIFRCVFKPTPSISTPQKTVNISKKTNEIIKIQGRHDPAVIQRASVIMNSVTAIVLYDMIINQFGKNFFLDTIR